MREEDRNPPGEGISRRRFLRAAGAAAVGTAYLAACSRAEREAFFQKRFQELSKEDLREVLSRLEKEASTRFGKPVHVSAEPPITEPETLFGAGLDLSRCIGCRRCVYACVRENNPSRDPQVHWIKVLALPKEKGVDVMEADLDYDAPLVPEPDSFYFPTSCQQCRKPQCTTVCPVKATWIEPDGIVVVDYNWCIGCRYCMAACPYHARHFNWAEPSVPTEEVNPHTHYLGNRPRPKGVVEKCTFCIQRVRKGRYPACVEICPTGSRKFGNLKDPASEIRYVLEHKRVFVFKEELLTVPKFYYFY
ncbi:MAG: 4Fe-4S dicluster domain-containing protein [Planctomycetota bacterium]|jgi:molybdopterin-containing oxidoreductase family iron-sulfur binding subunit